MRVRTANMREKKRFSGVAARKNKQLLADLVEEAVDDALVILLGDFAL